MVLPLHIKQHLLRKALRPDMADLKDINANYFMSYQTVQEHIGQCTGNMVPSLQGTTVTLEVFLHLKVHE